MERGTIKFSFAGDYTYYDVASSSKNKLFAYIIIYLQEDFTHESYGV